MLDPADLEDLDDIDRDMLARAILEACRIALSNQSLEFRRVDIPALMELRERVRPAYSRERRVTTGELTR